MQPSLNFETPTENSLIQTYVEELLKWNQTHNLISKNTEKDILKRHIEDSLQIKKFIKPEDKIIFDFGSGAGLPAIVMAITFLNEDKNFYLFESNTKKAGFLAHIAANLKLKNVTICNERIETSKLEVKADVITARAFAALVDIFKTSRKLIKPETKYILHKGLSVTNEIAEAKKRYNFEYNLHQSTSGDGFILECNFQGKK